MLQVREQPSTVFRFVDASKLVGLKVLGAVVADDLVERVSSLYSNADTRLATAEH